jgi:hypothetical protein
MHILPFLKYGLHLVPLCAIYGSFSHFAVLSVKCFLGMLIISFLGKQDINNVDKAEGRPKICTCRGVAVKLSCYALFERGLLFLLQFWAVSFRFAFGSVKFLEVLVILF